MHWDSEIAGPIILSTLFGIILPSVDTGTDIRLGVRLYLNGHPKWAMCVLGPVILNTILTLIGCQILEKGKGAIYKVSCFILVLLQVYPQCCVIRLIWHLYVKKIKNIGDFVIQNDGLSGDLGSVEPYVESVPQAYIQTAFFWVANSLSSTVERLCYNDKERSCEEYDECNEFNKCSQLGFDYNNCNIRGYEPYHYKTTKEVGECVDKTQNCTTEFANCIEPFWKCLEFCQTNLTSNIRQVDETWLYGTYANGNEEWMNNTWVLNYGASKEDLKRIQLYVLFIGDAFIFLSTYVISVFAATYGVTKYFRLGRTRFTEGCLSISYIGTFLITLIFLIGKGGALAVMVQVHTNSLLENTCWWLLFNMAPQFILALGLALWGTSFWAPLGSSWFPKIYAVKMIAKQPPILIAPCVTPFTYTIDSDFEKKIWTREGKLNKTVKIEGEFEFSKIFSFFNCIITVISTSAGLIWKAEQNVAIVLAVAFPVLAILPFLMYLLLDDLEDIEECSKHRKHKCEDCFKFYGFCNVINTYDICPLHLNKLPCKGSNHQLNDLHPQNTKEIKKIDMILTHPILLDKFKQCYIFPQLERINDQEEMQRPTSANFFNNKEMRQLLISQSDLEEIQKLTHADLQGNINNPLFQKVTFIFLIAIQLKELTSFARDCGMNGDAIEAAIDGDVDGFLREIDRSLRPILKDTMPQTLQKMLTNSLFLEEFRKLDSLNETDKEELSGITVEDLKINTQDICFQKAAIIFLKIFRSRRLVLLVRDLGMGEDAVQAANEGDIIRFFFLLQTGKSNIDNTHAKAIINTEDVEHNLSQSTEDIKGNAKVSVVHINEHSAVLDSHTIENDNNENNALPYSTDSKESISEKDECTGLLEDENKESNPQETECTPYADLLVGRNISTANELGMLLIDAVARTDERDLSDHDLANFIRNMVSPK